MTIIVEVRTKAAGRELERLLHTPFGLDVWEAKRDRLVLRATEAQIDRITKMGYAVRQIQTVERHVSTFAASAVPTGFHSAQQIENGLRSLAQAHPEIAELREIGRSLENRPMFALRIGERRSSARKMLFMGCHHAREWISVEVPYLMAQELVEKSNTVPIKNWLSAGEIWIAPLVNPDGHEFTRVAPDDPDHRLWRKNRRPNADGSIGVDLNRNYGYMWGTLDVPTSSHVPSDETYIGPRAFSEPESQAIRNLIATERFSGLITYHSYSQLILYPWGYTATPLADVPDRTRLSGLAQTMAEKIKQVHGTNYVPEQSSQLYPTAGDTTDWSFGEYHIPSFTIELRPSAVDQGGFIVPADQIQPTWEENRAAAFYLIEQILMAPAAVG
jgi:carboxypeptidase T